MELDYQYDTKLEEIKNKVVDAHHYFRKNIDRYNEFMKFVFNTSLTNEDVTKLQALQKPTLEFNIIESIISNLRGQFEMHEPSVIVRASEGMRIKDLTPQYMETMKVVENYIRHLINDSTNDGLQYKLFTDCLGGGFSVCSVFYDYLNDFSFDHKILVDRVFDPTLTGFDPLARLSHKGDGEYCYQLYPMTKAEFASHFGKEALRDIKFRRIEGFNWSYTNQKQDIILVCEFFQKEHKKVRIVKLSSGHVTTEAHYNELLTMWNEIGFIEQPPIILDRRMSKIETIKKYTVCETEILKQEKTIYSHLPLIFIDGNSIDIKDSDNSASGQMTRPYAYQAKGIQRLRNFAGQTIASEIENMNNHRYKVAIESIPDDYLEEYRNVQQMSTLLYNAFHNGDTSVPLPPPMEIQRIPTPPIVETTFLGSDKVTQAILGNYDGVLATNEQDVSGKAIANGSIKTSAASTPYMKGYINGLNRIAEVVLDLMPKIFVTPRTIPVMDIQGKRTYKVINDPNVKNSIELRYRATDLAIEVEAGVNNSLQKSAAIDQIIKMKAASDEFANFINTMGLDIIVDNLDIRNVESLKLKADEYMKMKKQQQEQAAQQPDPMQEILKAEMEMEHQKIEQKEDEMEAKLAIDSAKLAIEKQKVDAQVAEILSKIENQELKTMLEHAIHDNETAKAAVDTALALSQHHMEQEIAREQKEQAEEQQQERGEQANV